MAIMKLYCEPWHVSSRDEDIAQPVAEFNPESVIYNIEAYNGKIHGSAHH